MTSPESAASSGPDGAARTGRPVVYLHVGEPKSGTTFLQQVMWDNRAALARQGVLLPGHHAQDHFRANQDLREVRQADDDPAGSWAGEWDLLAAQAREAEHVAVISHELLAGATAAQAARAVASLAPAEVHVVLTIRDLASLMPAEWQETVKHRNRRGWHEWLEDVIDGPRQGRRSRPRWFWRAHDTLDVLRRWTQGVPPERVHVITMPRRGSPPDLLWHRFASVLGVDPDSADTSGARANTSLGVAEVELLRRVNQALPREVPHWFYAPHVKERLAHEVLAARPNSGGRLQLPTERQEWATERSERVIEELRASGYDLVGDLDELRPTPPSEPGLDPRDVPAEDVLDAAVASLVALLCAEYDRARARPGLRDGLVAWGRDAVRSSSRVKRTVRQLTGSHGSVRRARILVWRWSERVRSRRSGV